MNKKAIIAILAVVALAVIVVIVSPKNDTNKKGSTGDAKKKIGILQLVDHPSLDSAKKGFVDGLAESGYRDGKEITIDFLNAQADQSNLKTMSQRLVSGKNDLILAIATPAAQALANETKEIPILTTAVTDLVTAKLIESNDRPGTNVSGTSDMTPIEAQIQLLKQLVPSAKTVGILYNSSEVNSKLQVDLAIAEAKRLGMKTEVMTVTSTNDIAQNTQVLAKKVDAIYIPTDNTLASAMTTVGKIAIENKLPVIAGEENSVKTGGLATVGIDYYKLGQQTAKMAVGILEGKQKIAEMPVQFQKETQIYINKSMAEKIGLTIPQELEAYAK